MQRSHRRSTKVCTRCRRRKTKCDFKFPACTPCKLAKTDCLGFDPATREPVPRSLVRSLEARVAELEAQTLAFQAAPENIPGSFGSLIGQATISFGISKSTNYLRSKISSGLIFQPSCPPLAIVRVQEITSSNIDPNHKPATSGGAGKHIPNTIIDVDSVPVPAIERIAENYASTHLPQYPCISRSLLQDIVERWKRRQSQDKSPSSEASNQAELNHFESFVLNIVLAISTMTLTWKADDPARRASESFYNSALTHLQQLEDNSEIRALQISLLLAHYSHMCPERVDNWTCISNAVRIVLNLGMFRKCPDTMSEDQVRERTELFWVTYGMERSLCTQLRLPLMFPEEVITANTNIRSSHPNDPDLISGGGEKRSSADHIRKYRMLETEVHRVLHLGENMGRFGNTTVDHWIQDISARLESWYNEAQCFTQHNMLEFKHIQFRHLQARIHRPTTRLRSRTPHDRQIVLEASGILIEDYKDQEKRRRLFYPWHGVHILFEIALVSLEACWSSRDSQSMRQAVLQMLEVHIPQCIEVIMSIGERWTAAIACADRLKPLVANIQSALAHGNLVPFPVLDNTAITEEIESLLFSEGPLIWNHENMNRDLFGLEDLTINMDFPLVDDMEFFHWDPDWNILPMELINHSNSLNHAL